jgi:predicted esterase YcpF (UPF0227 family)
MHAPTHLLYLHGFRSSPQSAKALQTGARLQAINATRSLHQLKPVHWLCPQLPPSPAQAMTEVLALVHDVAPGRLALVGSSLGGFYATYLAQRLDGRAALLNPAVNPARDLRSQIGELTAWNDPQLAFHFTAEHVRELHALELGDLSRPVSDASRYLAVIAQDDEVLDWREMATRYAGCAMRLVPSGGHGLSDYTAQHLDAVLDFLGIAMIPHANA